MAKSQAFAEQVVADYQAGRNAASRDVSCFEAHTNVKLQAHAKMAECAFAMWAGADPNYALRWERFCDDGSDFFFHGWRWDIKATSVGGRFLIWPIAKNHIFDSKRFDMLALVRGNVPEFEIAGCISKEGFARRKQIADAGHKLVVGTWHMHMDDLSSVQWLEP